MISSTPSPLQAIGSWWLARKDHVSSRQCRTMRSGGLFSSSMFNKFGPMKFASSLLVDISRIAVHRSDVQIWAGRAPRCWELGNLYCWRYSFHIYLFEKSCQNFQERKCDAWAEKSGQFFPDARNLEYFPPNTKIQLASEVHRMV